MDLNGWFEKGWTGREYIDSMKVNREELLSVYERYSLPEEDRRYYESLRERNLRAVVLTADWCGDAMLCVPILMRIAEAAAIDMRYLNRDDHPELMDRYLTNGKSRSIPIFIFIAPDGKEVAVWGPRSPEVQRLVDEMRAALPSKEDPDFEEKQREMYRGFKTRLLEERQLWETVNRSVKKRFREQRIS
ncbi:thioredoxin-like protein [Melghirimyces profundicolus]|uniref:Thioredoxin-like protein n=1 Tax=Melghirimyces profundicolus TaxID=1242148 RepID=A0A2T6BRZ9_9BACL|nr:thioredoxin family protein [Melghirimyces profundicolus]PTX58865.1 thioredoxin-like protein [Melghirimyces profundicolus]